MQKRCNNGHYYDTTRHSSCPFCGVPDIDVSVTMAVGRNSDLFNFANGGLQDGDGVTTPLNGAAVPQTPAVDTEKTIGIYQNKMGFEPVVGWLVCVSGPDKGKDYRIKSERNFIGRGSEMDISIKNDMGISRVNHAIISYSPKTRGFKIAPGEGHGMVYLNDEELYSPEPIKRGDIIEMGETKLYFVPLCGEDFQWEKE